MENNTTLDYKLYLAQREIIKNYNRTILKSYNLSYQHYLVLMVLHEHKALPVLQLGEKLAFQSGTITPILKKMEVNGYVERERLASDERVVIVELTEKGQALIEELSCVPETMFEKANLSLQDYKKLMELSKKLTENMKY